MVLGWFLGCMFLGLAETARFVVDVDQRPADTVMRDLTALDETLLFLDQDGFLVAYADGHSRGPLAEQRFHEIFVKLSQGLLLLDNSYQPAMWFFRVADQSLTLVGEFDQPSLMQIDGSRALFSQRANQSRELWLTDGTVRGTFPLGAFEDYVFRAQLLGNQVWIKDIPQSDIEILWCYDLPTRTLKQVVQHQRIDGPHRRGDVLYYFAFDQPTSRLWKISAGGKREAVTDFESSYHGRGQILGEIYAASLPLVFRVSPFNKAFALWQSDGTSAGTRPWLALGEAARSVRIGGYRPGDRSLLLKTFADYHTRVYLATLESNTPRLLHERRDEWEFEGLAVADLGFWFSLEIPRQGYPVHVNRLEWWFTDGTPEGTRKLYQAQHGRDGLEIHNAPVTEAGNLFWVAEGHLGWRLWRSDGTVAGTIPLPSELAVSKGVAQPLAVKIDERVYFHGHTHPHGAELMVTDGFTQWLAMDLNPGVQDQGQVAWTLFQNQLIFAAGRPDTGLELWRLSGENAQLIQDLFAGAGSSNPQDPVVHQGELYWAGREARGPRSFWKWDGEQPIRALEPENHSWSWNPRHLYSHGEYLFFAGFSTCSGYELYRGDGSGEGVEMLANLAGDIFDMPHCHGESSRPHGFTSLGEDLFFKASPFAPTRWYRWHEHAPNLLEIEPDWDDRRLPPPIAIDGKILWINPERSRQGIWQLASVDPEWTFLTELPAVAPHLSATHLDAIAVNGKLVFFRSVYDRGNRSFALEVWAWAGTGFTLLRAFPLQGVSSWSALTVFRSGQSESVFFTFPHDGLGRELFVSDGTREGTHLVADLYPGAEGSGPETLKPIRGRFYWTAGHPDHGRELWRMHPQNMEPQLVSDIVPGPASSNPETMAALGNQIYLLAEDPDAGKSVYRLPLEDPSAGPDRNACGTGVHLQAELPGNARGRWTLEMGEGGILADAEDPHTWFEGVEGESYRLRWDVLSADGLASHDQVTIRFHAPTLALDPGEDQHLCHVESVALQAETPPYGYGKWELAAGAGDFDDVYSPRARFFPRAPYRHTYRLRWVHYHGECRTESEDLLIEIHIADPTFAGADQKPCEGKTRLAALPPGAGETGRWTIVSGEGGQVSDPHDPKAEMSGLLGETYVLQWTLAGEACGERHDRVSIAFIPVEGGIEGPSRARSGEDVMLRATPGMASYLWPDGSTNADYRFIFEEATTVWVEVGDERGCIARWEHPVQLSRTLPGADKDTGKDAGGN